MKLEKVSSKATNERNNRDVDAHERVDDASQHAEVDKKLASEHLFSLTQGSQSRNQIGMGQVGSAQGALTSNQSKLQKYQIMKDAMLKR